MATFLLQEVKFGTNVIFKEVELWHFINKKIKKIYILEDISGWQIVKF